MVTRRGESSAAAAGPGSSCVTGMMGGAGAGTAGCLDEGIP